MPDNKFIKVDLHIHTPASVSCYKGKKNDKEYFDILTNAKKNALKVIAITDHNSINGYKKLMSSKNNLLNEKNTLTKITDSTQAKKNLSTLENTLSLFDDILILPGVEFEARPGIHLLVIFNNSTSTEIIDKFLLDGGHGLENSGQEEPPKQSNWDVTQLLEEVKKYDCIVIDAHTDSNKGIWNTLKGQARAHCFHSPQLSAVCYNNEEQKDKIRSTLKNEDYDRPNLAFIKSSDAHNSESVGSQYFWIKITDSISFESLKIAFSNPSEMISIEEPSMSKILDKLLKLDTSFGVPDLSSKSNIKLFKNLICAFNNSDGGYILLGVTEKKNKVGMIIPKKKSLEESITLIAKSIYDCVTSVERIRINFRDTIIPYLLQNNRVIISLYIKKGSNLVNVKHDGLLYSIKNRRLCILSASDIEFIVHEHVTREIEQSINKRITAIENDCRLIKHLFASMPIIRNFEKNSTHVSFKISISDPIKLESSVVSNLTANKGNGTSRGNLFFCKDFSSPRLSYAYLRNSLPLYFVRSSIPKSQIGETIYLVPKGGIFYSNREYPYFSDEVPLVIKITGISDKSTYSMKFLTSYLKSNFFLWYISNKYNTFNILDPDKTNNIFSDFQLPTIYIKNQSHSENIQNIHNLFDEILKIEAAFLINVRKINPKDEDKIVEFTERHNSETEKMFYHIDCIIYQLIGLSESDIQLIEDNLELNGIYVPKKRESPLVSINQPAKIQN